MKLQYPTRVNGIQECFGVVSSRKMLHKLVRECFRHMYIVIRLVVRYTMVYISTLVFVHTIFKFQHLFSRVIAYDRSHG